jgi:hypothetical protein
MRSAWAAISLLALLLAILFVVPDVRAEIVRFLQIGAVRIFLATATQTVEVPIPQVPLTATPIALPPNTALPQFTSTPIASQYEPLYSITMSDLAGETTLEAAQATAQFPIRLPGYPADLGAPEHIFLQEYGLMVILVWTDPTDAQKVRLSLHEIGSESILVKKFEPIVIQETQVNGGYAVWAQGPYLVQLTDGTYTWRRFVQGNTLIWEENEITYRLESELSLEETVKIAESLE